MKLRIKKVKNKLNERYEIVQQLSSDFILNQVLDPSASGSIFNKKLIFYDLETMGFLPQAYVHQIAALEYDLRGSFEKIFKGEDLTNEDLLAPNPESGCIVKCAFEEERFKEGDEEVRKKRQDFANRFEETIDTNQSQLSFDDEQYSSTNQKVIDVVNKSLYTTNEEGEKTINMSMTASDISASIMGSVLATKTGAEDFYKTLEAHLKNLNKSNKYLTENLKALKGSTGKEDFETLLSSEETSEDSIKEFLFNLYKFVQTIVESPYTFPSSKTTYMTNLRTKHFVINADGKLEPKKEEDGTISKYRMRMVGHYYANLRGHTTLAKLKKMTTKYARREFNLTWAENKNFTKYQDFPLPEYFKFVKFAEDQNDSNLPQNDFQTGKEDSPTETKRMPSQKEGLEIFLKYLEEIGNNNYVLVGHNIKAFDNSVILAKSQEEGINRDLILSFQDSYVFDTLPLMKIYVQQIKYMDALVTAKINDKLRDAGSEDLATSIEQTKAQHDALRERYPGLKSKLDGLMALHESTKGLKQTHTADDDCKQLANVFIPTILEMTKMLKDYNGLLESMTKEDGISVDAEELQTFDDKTFSQQVKRQSALKGPVVSKLKSDLLFDENDLLKSLSPHISVVIDDLDFIPDHYADAGSTYKAIQDYKNARKAALDKLIGRFFYYINEEINNKGRIDNATLRKVLTLSRREVLEYFKAWIEVISNRPKDNEAVGEVIQFFENEAELKARAANPETSTSKPEQSTRTKSPRDLTTENKIRLEESIVNKWKKMIK